MNQNRNKVNEDRFYGTITGRADIYDGLSFQARVSIDHTKYKKDSRRYATTFLPSNMDDYGNYWKDIETANEIYTDYLLSYNKTFGDFSVSATAGWVGHLRETETQKTDVVATYIDPNNQMLSTRVNLFQTNAGGTSATKTTKLTDWDKAALVTAQLGWQEKYISTDLIVEIGIVLINNFPTVGHQTTTVISESEPMPLSALLLNYPTGSVI